MSENASASFTNYIKSISKSRTRYGEHIGVVLLQRLLNPLTASAALYLIGFGYGMEMQEPYYIGLAIVTFMLALGIFEAIDLYSAKSGLTRWSQFHTLLLAWTIIICGLLFLGYATKLSDIYSRRILLTWFVVAPILIFIVHESARFLCYRVLGIKHKTRHAALIGINELSRQLAKTLRHNPRLGIRVEGFFDDRTVERTGTLPEGRRLGRFSELPTLIKQKKIDTIFIALPLMQQKRILDLVESLRDTTASVYYIPNVFLFDLIQARLDDIHGVPVVALCETPFYGAQALTKRLSDIVMASLLVLVLAPLMALIAIGVKLSSPGPILFKQRRYGLDGKEILIYKFRSMTTYTDGDKVTQAVRNDTRTTSFGRFIRRTSLDELPQFINVLQGSMSVIGPRPHAVAHNEEYRKKIKGYMIRHKVKPGITGLAQVRGLRGGTESLEKMEARVESDLEYMRNWSLSLDVLIILKTFIALLKTENAY